ncbi:MAG: RNA polymerase sigma factor [Lewinellaceae bacterium]|nr:RNA polymerase sigma factor [Lewinellaceae bacterium]
MHEDQRYIEGLKRGDEKVIQEIYSRYSGFIKNWINQNNGSADDAQDVFQDALLALFERAGNQGITLTSPFQALLFTVCRNKWLDRLRHKTREGEVRNQEELRYEGEAADTDTLAFAEAAEEEQRRQKCLEATFRQLTERCQQLLTFLQQEVAVDDIALRLSMSGANAVYQARFKCSDRWRQLFYATFNG